MELLCTRLIQLIKRALYKINAASLQKAGIELLYRKSIQQVYRKKVYIKLFDIYNIVQSWVGNETCNQNFVY